MAGRIPQNFIDDLVSRADIVELVNARVPLRKKGKEYTACCPFHGEKTPSFTVSESKQFYHCFGCGAHGTALGFLMEYENLDFIEAVEALASEYNLEVPRENTSGDFKPAENTKKPLLDILEKVSQVFQAQLKKSTKAVAYLKNRGLTGEIAKQYRIGFAPEGWQFISDQFTQEADKQKLIKTGLIIKKDNGQYYDRFRDRIIFPILNTRGLVIGFGGRIIDDGEPKYLNSPENEVFYKGFELYGLHEAKKNTQQLNNLIVVEGYMDVVALAQHGITNAVASLGTATTTDQIKKILRSVQEIIFCYDGDTAGKKAAWRALENTLPILRDGQVIKFLFLPEKEDPDSMVRKEGKDNFLNRMSSATPLSDFLFNTLTQQADITNKEGKAKLVEISKPLLSTMQDGVLKDLLLDELAKLVDRSADQIRERIPFEAQQKRNPVRQTLEKKSGQSTIRRTIALLLQHPSLASTLTLPDNFSACDLPGFSLLHQIHTSILNSPNITTAALIERFRDTDEERILNKLVQLEIPVTDDQKQKNTLFADYINNLIATLNEAPLANRQAELEAKFSTGKLTEEEKKEYQSIISGDLK